SASNSTSVRMPPPPGRVSPRPSDGWRPLSTGSGEPGTGRPRLVRAGTFRRGGPAAERTGMASRQPLRVEREVSILMLIGTRPEAIKMLPVVLALRASEWFEPVVVTTGQHRDLVDPILELGGVVPDAD